MGLVLSCQQKTHHNSTTASYNSTNQTVCNKKFGLRPKLSTLPSYHVWSMDTSLTRDRQTGRQTDRHTDRQTDIQTDRQTDRQTDWLTDRQTDRQTKIRTYDWRQHPTVVHYVLLAVPDVLVRNVSAVLDVCNRPLHVVTVVLVNTSRLYSLPVTQRLIQVTITVIQVTDNTYQSSILTPCHTHRLTSNTGDNHSNTGDR